MEQLFEIDIGGLRVTTKDISVSAALVDEFGERIPVLQCDGFELEAPFDKKSVRDLDFQFASISVNPKKLMAFCVVC